MFEQITVKLVEPIKFYERELDHKTIHNLLRMDIDVIQGKSRDKRNTTCCLGCSLLIWISDLYYLTWVNSGL